MLKKYFFDWNKTVFGDRVNLVHYVTKFCKEETAHVIETADNVVDKKFLFNMRWDMERTYEPVVFTDQIDWVYQPQDDPEWIFAFNRMRFWVCLGQAYAITGNEKYAQSFAQQLSHWIDTVKKDEPKFEKAWRTIEVGIRLDNWLKTMCYFETSPSITPVLMEKFVKSIVEHADFILSVYNSFNYMSNWGVLANHGLFLAGALLPSFDKESKKRNTLYIQTSLYRLSQICSVQVYDDGMHWEQSTMYHNEILKNLLDVVFIAQRKMITIPYPISEKTLLMAYADIILQKPNGHEIAMGDSDDIDQRDIITKAACIFNDSALKASGYEIPDFDTVWDLGYEIVKLYKNLKAKHLPSLSNGLNESGHVCFRSNWDSDAIFLHFSCGTLGAGHGHDDKLHIDLFANGEDIFLDPGRFTYVDKKERYEFKTSSAHNTCTIDGISSYTFIDSWGCSSLSKSVNFKWKDSGPYAYCEGGHLGYQNGGDLNVFVSRKILYLKPDIFIINDSFYTNEDHLYDMFLHFNKGELVPNLQDINIQKGSSWSYVTNKNKVQLTVLGNNVTSKIIPGKISRHYNQWEQTPVLQSSWDAKGFTSLFTVVSLNSTKLKVTKVPVLSNFKNAVFPPSMIEAIELEDPISQRAYTAVFAHQEYASPTDTFCAGGITEEELLAQNIQMWEPGNKPNRGVSNNWGALNSHTGCTGFGQLVVFDRSPQSPDAVEGDGFRTGTILAV